MEFIKFPKLYRLNGPVIITEKIDGTNACIVIENGEIYAQSRTRIITPENDNFGFAKWVHANKDALINVLGEGRHYGEWWGSGIQRGYGLKVKVFSLFNTSRWKKHELITTNMNLQLDVVPTLFEGTFTEAIEEIPVIMGWLKKAGSVTAPEFMNPEGIVIYDTNSGVGYKKTFDYDDTGKGGIRDIDGNIIAPK
jgi:hypothetical protein